MRIGLLTSSLGTSAGGLLDATRQLALHLQTYEDIVVEVFGTLDNSFRSDDWSDIKVNALRGSWPWPDKYYPALTRTLINADLDLIHMIGLWDYSTIACTSWHKKTGRPYITAPHGMLEPWALENSKLKKKIAMLLYQQDHFEHSAQMVALNENEKQNITAITQTPCSIIPNGVEATDSLTFGTTEWEEAIGKDDNVMLFLGRLHEKKNVEPLVEAFSLSTAPQNSWHLVIAGTGSKEYTNRLHQSAAGKENIHLVGGQFGQDKLKSFQRAEVFALPSLSEGQPIAVLEAMSHKLPVMISAESNLPEALNIGAGIECGTTVASIREAIDKIVVMSANEREQMGRLGLALCRDHFSWKKTAESTVKLYQKILSF